jgi:hypothetical protein
MFTLELGLRELGPGHGLAEGRRRQKQDRDSHRLIL